MFIAIGAPDKVKRTEFGSGVLLACSTSQKLEFSGSPSRSRNLHVSLFGSLTDRSLLLRHYSSALNMLAARKAKVSEHIPLLLYELLLKLCEE